MNTQTHWNHIYQTKAPTQVSWYQAHPALSLDLIKHTHIQPTDPIIDIGGGASTLVDELLTNGFHSITVLDISAHALHVAHQRLGPLAHKVTWLEADLTEMAWPVHAYAVWHDRAVFHFLTQPFERQRYLAGVRRAVRPGGYVIVATFAPDGPSRCSGLDVMRYSPNGLHHAFGQDFELVDSASETHRTPAGAEQKFTYCYCRRN